MRAQTFILIKRFFFKKFSMQLHELLLTLESTNEAWRTLEDMGCIGYTSLNAFKIAVTAHHCLNGLAPAHLTELCNPVTQKKSSCHLSSYCHRLAVLSVKLSIGSHSFSLSGPTAWNALLDYLRNPTLPTDVFKSHLKTFLLAHDAIAH